MRRMDHEIKWYEASLQRGFKAERKEKWVVEGDENSKFFHSLLRNKFTQSTIHGVHINGVWYDSPNLIKLGALNHFASIFKEENHSRCFIIRVKNFYGRVIAKILAIRLAKLISSIIRSNQTAFISGRQILDRCIVANELIRMAHIKGHNLLLFKWTLRRPSIA
ncbi:hypothetical protein Tco_1408012 [Tanacetum coccineum]